MLEVEVKRDGKIYHQEYRKGVPSTKLKVLGKTESAAPNSPQEDVFRMADVIAEIRPDCVLAASGGSGIDAAKAAIVLADLGGELEDYFGVGRVNEKIAAGGTALTPCVASRRLRAHRPI